MVVLSCVPGLVRTESLVCFLCLFSRKSFGVCVCVCVCVCVGYANLFELVAIQTESVLRSPSFEINLFDNEIRLVCIIGYGSLSGPAANRI